jgi:hypothetical protein
MQNILTLRLKNLSDFMDAKLWFDSKSSYVYDNFSSQWKSFDFECSSGGDIDSLEPAIESELVLAGFDNFYFESN